MGAGASCAVFTLCAIATGQILCVRKVAAILDRMMTVGLSDA
jgi:hypothetical protein